jgi:hypothetical protein
MKNKEKKSEHQTKLHSGDKNEVNSQIYTVQQDTAMYVVL